MQKNCDNCTAGVNGSNPIHTALGNKLQYEVDLTLPNGLSFGRYYSSASHWTVTSMGAQWRHSFDATVFLADGSASGLPITAWVQRPDGSTYAFNKTADGSWKPEPDVTLALAAEYSGTQLIGWIVKDRNNKTEHYDFDGRLLQIDSLDQGPISLEYNEKGFLQSITDEKGRSITLVYDTTTGLLTDVFDPTGANYHYGYDALNNLISVQRPTLPSGELPRQYHYEDAAYPHALTGVTDENGNRYASWAYDSAGRANLSVHGQTSGLVDRYAFTFNGDGTTTVVDPLNQSRTFSFQLSHGVKRFKSVSQFCPSCGGTTAANVTYDANGFVDLTTDFNGTVSDKDFNSRGLLTQEIESQNKAASKRKTQTDWHASYALPIERRTYDQNNVLVSRQTWSYNARGQVTTFTVGQLGSPTEVRANTFTYCEQAGVTAGTCPLVGLLLSADGPRTDVTDITSYMYYGNDDPTCASAPSTCPHRKGDLWKVTNAANQTTETIRYDGAGRPLSMKDPTGLITDFEYHPRGWLSAKKVRGADDASETDDLITRVEYYATGLVKKVILPDGSYTSYTYDAAHRLTDVADSFGNTIHYDLDHAGNRIGEKNKNGAGDVLRSISRVYNLLGELRTSKDAYDHATDFTYDANGNLDTTKDPLLRVSDTDYDPLNRLTKIIQDASGIAAETKFEYDALGQLSRITDPKGLTTSYDYSEFGDLRTVQSPDTGTTSYTHDTAGNLRTRLDARGITTTYSYDGLNRLTSISNSDGTPGVTFNYDAPTSNTCDLMGISDSNPLGRLERITDSSGSTYYCYDRFGRIRGKNQAINDKSFGIVYGYTAAGRPSSVKYPSGDRVDYVRNVNGQVSGVTWTTSEGVPRVLLSNVTYYPFGPAGELEYADGRRLKRTLNQNYQPGIVEDVGPGGLSFGYEFDSVGNLLKLRTGSQSEPPLRRYVHDGLNRLTETRDGATDALLHSYGYDATGNRISATAGDVTTAYSYPTTSHRLASVDAFARVYDSAGNTTSIAAEGGMANRWFVFDASNRMTEAHGPNGTMTYAYNGKGEQVRRYPTVGSQSQYFVYDEAGHLLGMYDATGARVQEIIWLDDLPVGVIANDSLHFIEPDYLGTPRVVIDPAREVAVWSWPLTGESFGNTQPNQDPDADGLPFTFDLRFPGQRQDAVSGLFYNYFRNYDPSSGRYVEPDPVGLNGGISMFSYVDAAPHIGVDLHGLKKCKQVWEVSGRYDGYDRPTTVSPSRKSTNCIPIPGLATPDALDMIPNPMDFIRGRFPLGIPREFGLLCKTTDFRRVRWERAHVSEITYFELCTDECGKQLSKTPIDVIKQTDFRFLRYENQFNESSWRFYPPDKDPWN